jgi:hypothetical protein
MMNKQQLREMLDAIKLEVDIIQRNADSAHYAVIYYAIPEEILNDSNLTVQHYLSYLLDPTTQYEIMRRSARVYESVVSDLDARIDTYGKNDPDRVSISDWKSLELVSLLPVIDSANTTSVWEPFEWLGRRVFYEEDNLF